MFQISFIILVYVFLFINGYSPTSPTFKIKLDDIEIGKGNYKEWGAPISDYVFKLKLGSIITE